MWTGKFRQFSTYITSRGVDMIVESFMMFLQKIMLFTSYINSNSSFPKPLTPEEELKYLQLNIDGDKRAKEKLRTE